MLSKTISYDNLFSGRKVEETHYFHISKADLVEMEIEEHAARYVDKDGAELTGMQAKLKKIMEAEDGRAIISEIKDIIRRSYGVKQGDRFIKTQENWDEFASGEAFSELFFELCTDALKSAEFMGGIIPDNLDQIADEVRSLAEQARSKGGDTPEDVAGVATPVPQPPVPDPEPAATPEPPAPGMTNERKAVLDLATPDNPIKLDQVDFVSGDATYIQAGIRDGRFQV